MTILCNGERHYIPVSSVKAILSRKDMNQSNISRVYKIYKHIYSGTDKICKLKDIRNFYTDTDFSKEQIKFLKINGLYNNENVKLSVDNNGFVHAYVPAGKTYHFPGYLITPDCYHYNELKDYIDKLDITADGTVAISEFYYSREISKLPALMKYAKHINTLKIQVYSSMVIEYHNR